MRSSRICNLLILAAAASAAANARGANVTISLAYYDNEHPNGQNPNPWSGSPNTTFFGSLAVDGIWDTGAILLTNNGSTSVLLSPGVTIDGFANGASFRLWDSSIGSGATLAPGQRLILAQFGSGTFDSSDQPIINNPANRTNNQPVVHLTLDGVPYNFLDAKQVLNTGGFDPGEAYHVSESIPWTAVGRTSIVGATWSNASGGSWGASANWNVAAVPTIASDTAAFGPSFPAAAAAVTLDGSRAIGSLTFNNVNTVTINPGSGGTLALDNLSNAAAISVLAGNHALNAPVALNTSATITVSNGASLVISGQVADGTSSNGLSLAGGGTLTLTAANSYTGITTIGAGTLRLGDGIANNGSVAGNIVNNAALVFANPNSLAYGGNISGTGSLTKTGAGTLNLTGGASSFSGGMTINQGSVAASQALAYSGLGSGPITLAGGTLALQGAQLGTAGLLGKFYSTAVAGTPSAADFVSVASLAAKYGPLTPTETAQATVGGFNMFNFGANFQAAANNDPAFNGGAQNFAAVWAGKFNTPASAGTSSYTFTTNSDDGSMLFIDRQLVVYNNFDQPPTPRSGTITLAPGLHDIEIGFYQHGGGYALSAQVQNVNLNGNNAQDIPLSADATKPGLLTLSNSTSQSYANNVIVDQTSRIDVSGSLTAALGALAVSGSTLNVTSSDATTAPYRLTFGATTLSGSVGLNVANSAGGGQGTVVLGAINLSGTAPSLIKSGNGTLEIDGAATLGGASALQVSSGKMRLNVTSGTVSVGAGVVATVAAGATLELAGSVSALASGINRANIINDSPGAPGPAGGVLVSGSHQQVGGIDGGGNVVVNAGSDLTANHILQNALIIGGTAGNAGRVTIDPSDSSGNPLAESSSQVSRLSLTGSLTPSGPFGAGVVSSISAINATDSSPSGSISMIASSATDGSSVGISPTAIPEPSAFMLSGLAGLVFSFAALRRRNDSWLRFLEFAAR